MDDLRAAPLVSVVTATYNRSHVLRAAIASVRGQTVSDWEHIVVGDACTDDTGQVVASFSDPRLRFVNLAENVGEQSGPNNEGIRLARGRYVAFLNHDDLWFSDHLQTLLETMEERRADVAYAWGVSLLPDGSHQLQGASGLPSYRPVSDVPASLWLCRREVFGEVGPWRYYRSCWATPSQDWLLRAWRAGKTIVSSDRATVIMVMSGYYRDSYRETGSAVHETLTERLQTDPGLREEMLTAVVRDLAAKQKALRLRPHLRGLARTMAFRPLLALGIPPVWVRYRLRNRRRGAFVDRLRRQRGLPPKARSGP